MCAANRGLPCPNCGTPIQKDSFLGGSITICSHCQPLDISA
ncbi:MAG: hypothetical protein LHW44_04180 [Candidatus Cloacimonetes bacterium]|nr:hypothetical protein [Candidatus Cloacimonadota bacterium]